VTFEVEVKTVNKKRLQSLALMGFIVAFLLLSSCSPVLATKPKAITFVEVPDTTTVLVPAKEVGINVITVIETTGTITGDITGTYTVQRRCVFHKALIGIEKMTTAQADFQINGIYDGKEGMIYLRLTYKIIVPEPTAPICTGNWAIIGGTEELANLRGQGTFTIIYNPLPPIRQFDGQVHFDP
jgi:hypothetical protein